jgi:AcrR family transcriptional regulator
MTTVGGSAAAAPGPLPPAAGPVEPPRPKRADARRNYDRIVAVASEVFSEQGPEAPLDEIARRAHVGPGTLYRRFPHRQALMEAVYREDIAELANRGHELLRELPPDQALGEWLRAQVNWVVRKRGFAVAVKAAMDTESETYEWCRATLRGAVNPLVAAAQQAGAVRDDLTTTDIMRIGHSIAIVVEADPDSAERLLSVMLAGLRPQNS